MRGANAAVASQTPTEGENRHRCHATWALPGGTSGNGGGGRRGARGEVGDGAKGPPRHDAKPPRAGARGEGYGVMEREEEVLLRNCNIHDLFE
jgi:hypothetical protein